MPSPYPVLSLQAAAAIGALSACALGDTYLEAFDREGQCGASGGAPTILQQCMAEQKYVRGAMMRSLLYNQVRAWLVGGKDIVPCLPAATTNMDS